MDPVEGAARPLAPRRRLTWDELTYGSWHPELLPTLVVREAYGTRRDTDWMDGFYPYHEMNAYLGLIALGLAVVGGGLPRPLGRLLGPPGRAGRPLMLGRFTFLFDYMHRIPVVGSSRIPVRFHLWVSLAVAALAAVGVDRLCRPGTVSLLRRGDGGRGDGIVLGSDSLVCLLSDLERLDSVEHALPSPAFSVAEPRARDCVRSNGRAGRCGMAGGNLGRSNRGCPSPGKDRRLDTDIILADLLGSHWQDVPTVSPSYWTKPPESATVIQSDVEHQRVFGDHVLSAGEPGYASGAVDEGRFFQARDTLAWSLPLVWGLSSAAGKHRFTQVDSMAMPTIFIPARVVSTLRVSAIFSLAVPRQSPAGRRQSGLDRLTSITTQTPC